MMQRVTPSRSSVLFSAPYPEVRIAASPNYQMTVRHCFGEYVFSITWEPLCGVGGYGERRREERGDVKRRLSDSLKGRDGWMADSCVRVRERAEGARATAFFPDEEG